MDMTNNLMETLISVTRSCHNLAEVGDRSSECFMVREKMMKYRTHLIVPVECVHGDLLEIPSVAHDTMMNDVIPWWNVDVTSLS